MIVDNLRGIELYGSVHTSISSGSKKDTKELFIFSEEFIGQALKYFPLYAKLRFLNFQLSKVNPQLHSNKHFAVHKKLYKFCYCI